MRPRMYMDPTVLSPTHRGHDRRVRWPHRNSAEVPARDVEGPIHQRGSGPLRQPKRLMSAREWVGHRQTTPVPEIASATVAEVLEMRIRRKLELVNVDFLTMRAGERGHGDAREFTD